MKGGWSRAGLEPSRLPSPRSAPLRPSGTGGGQRRRRRRRPCECWRPGPRARGWGWGGWAGLGPALWGWGSPHSPGRAQAAALLSPYCSPGPPGVCLRCLFLLSPPLSRPGSAAGSSPPAGTPGYLQLRVPFVEETLLFFIFAASFSHLKYLGNTYWCLGASGRGVQNAGVALCDLRKSDAICSLLLLFKISFFPLKIIRNGSKI